MDTHTPPLTITILVDGIEKMTAPSVSVAVGALRHSFGCLAWKNEKDLALSMANAEGRGLWVELKRKGFKTIQITWTHTQPHTQPHTHLSGTLPAEVVTAWMEASASKELTTKHPWPNVN